MRASTFQLIVFRLVLGASLLLAAVPSAAPVVRAAPLAAASVCEWTPGTYTVSGKVTVAAGAGVISAPVSLYTAEGRFVATTWTNGAGTYQFDNLPAGQYLLYASPPNDVPDFAPAWYSNQTNPANATPIVVGNGSNAIADVELPFGASFSGQIKGSDGAPLASARVRVYDRFGNFVANASTDAAGHFITAPGLVSGEYRLQFTLSAGIPYFGEYYPDQPSLDLAQPISVTAPNPITGIEAILERGGQITGRATVAGTGNGLRAEVYIEGNDTYVHTSTDNNGYFAYGPLASGEYTVSFHPFYLPSPLYGSTHQVAVTAPNEAANVDGVFMPGGQMTGHVANSSGSAAGVYVFAQHVDDGRKNRNATTDASGGYTIFGLAPGAYRVMFSLEGHASEYYNNQSPDAVPDLVTVTPPNVVAGINAALSAGGSLSGTVIAADTGLPLEAVAVRVELASNRDVNYSATTDANGHYEVHDLPAGQYRVRFRPPESGQACAYQMEWYSDKTSRSTADPVTVMEGALTPNVNAALARGSLLQGRVFDAADGTPLPNIGVHVLDATGRQAASAFTNVLGFYTTDTPLPSGAYHVLFTDYGSGYVDEYYDDALTLATAQPVHVTAPTDVTGLNAGLQRGGFIEGRVTAADSGQGLQGVQVTVYDTAGNPLAYAYTESSGHYKVGAGLPTGSYRVGFGYPAASGSGLAAPSVAELTAALYGLTPPDAHDPDAPPAEAQRGDAASRLPEALQPLASEASLAGGVFVDNPGYLPLFYNGKFTLAEADLVPVTAPNTTTGINAVFLYGVFVPMIHR